MSGQEFKDGDLMPWQDMTRAIKNLQVFTDEHTERLQELEARVDSLTRSLDILQEVMNIEVVVTPENIGELYDEQNIAL